MDSNAQRIELIESILRLPEAQLLAASEFLKSLVQPASPQIAEAAIKVWPHAPRHSLTEHGAYMVTTGTYQRAHVFFTADHLNLVENSLLATACRYDWHLEAWAVFSNHYHFVGYTLSDPPRLKEFLTDFHAGTAREINRLDGQSGRRVWHNFWDKQITFEKSYLARLNYVHQNAVKHGLVRVANQYPWCSAAWLERTARSAQVKTIYSFKTDGLKIADEFEPLVVLPKS